MGGTGQAFFPGLAATDDSASVNVGDDLVVGKATFGHIDKLKFFGVKNFVGNEFFDRAGVSKNSFEGVAGVEVIERFLFRLFDGALKIPRSVITHFEAVGEIEFAVGFFLVNVAFAGVAAAGGDAGDGQFQRG